MPKRRWDEIGVEVAIGVAFAGFSLMILLESPISVNGALRLITISFLFTLFVFVHFQYFNNRSVPDNVHRRIKKSIVSRAELANRLARGYRYVGPVDRENFVVES